MNRLMPITRPARSWPHRLLIAFLAMLCAATALRLVSNWVFADVVRAAGQPPVFAHLVERYLTSRVVFLCHVIGGGVALFVAPWQLARTRLPRLHRATGYVYVAAVALAGTAGIAMGAAAWGGPVARLGFCTAAFAWLATTALGLRAILSGDRARHRRWMMYSFALAFGAVTLRLESLVLILAGVPQATTYAIVAWSCWVPNVALVAVASPTGS